MGLKLTSLEQIKEYPMPTKSGFYWARSKRSMLFYDLIIQIHGNVPYLSFKKWDYNLNEFTHGIEPTGYHFGPEIIRPEVTICLV
jgi:hypothetical protein